MQNVLESIWEILAKIKVISIVKFLVTLLSIQK